MKYLVCVLTAVTLLGACGGGGGSDGVPGSWSGLATQFIQLGEEVNDTDYTTVAQMRTDSSATYRGVAAYGEGAVLSSAEMRANFSDASISGRLHNFQAHDGTPITGEVAIRDGAITGAEYAAELAGGISVSGRRYDVSGNVYGDFLGDRAEMIDGEINGWLNSEHDSYYFDGLMVLRE